MLLFLEVRYTGYTSELLTRLTGLIDSIKYRNTVDKMVQASCLRYGRTFTESVIKLIPFLSDNWFVFCEIFLESQSDSKIAGNIIRRI
jgi:hypothetical protein